MSEAEPIDPEEAIASPDAVHAGLTGHVSTIKHERLRTDTAAAALEPERVADATQLLKGYIHRRRKAKHPGELDMDVAEEALIGHLHVAQLKVARELNIEDAVARHLHGASYRIFDSKATMTNAIRDEAGSYWVPHDKDGAYTPITGALWVHTGNEQRMESGLARLVVQNAAAVVTVPYEAHDGAHDRKDLGHGLALGVGTGYDRPDLLPKESSIGVHKAVTDMATMRVLQHAKHRFPPLLHHPGLNAILDGVIKTAAAEAGKKPRIVANEVLRGYYTGVDGLDTIRQTLGEWGMYRFMTIDGTETPFDIHRLANELKIPWIADNYDAIMQHRPVPLYCW